MFMVALFIVYTNVGINLNLVTGHRSGLTLRKNIIEVNIHDLFISLYVKYTSNFHLIKQMQNIQQCISLEAHPHSYQMLSEVVAGD